MNFEFFSICQNLIKENKIELIQDFLKENQLTTKQLSKCLTISLINKRTSIEIIKLLIKSGANVNYRNRKSRRTALLTAICHSNSNEVIDFLVNSGSNLNIKDSRGKSILYHIMKYMKSDTRHLMNSVLERGVEINQEDRSTQNVLFYAIINQQPFGMIKFLIEKGANVDRKNLYGENLMHICAKYSPNIGLFQLLIDKGIEVNDTQQHFKTPLSYLLLDYQKNVEQIKFLVSKGANVGKSLFSFVMDAKYFEIAKFAFSIDSTSINEKNRLSETLLHRACLRKNNIKNIELIIQNGINVNEVDSFGSTALHVACQNRLENEVIKLLISSGVDPSIKNYFSYALEYFHKWDIYKDPELPEIMLLLFKGIGIDSRNQIRLSETAWRNFLSNMPKNNKELSSEIINILDTMIKLSYPYSQSYPFRRDTLEDLASYSYKNLEVFKFLFEKALEFKSKIKFTNIIYHVCNYPESSSLIVYILESLLKHPDINVVLNPSFLSFCHYSHGIEEFKLFLKMGVDVNYKDTYKITPLMYVCKFSPSFANISFLIESGADAFARDTNGNSILHHFCQSRSSSHKLIDIPELMKLFKSKGLSIHDKNNRNEDALICSCSNKFISDQLIRYLIEDGANLNSINFSNLSAFSLYLQNKNHCLETIKFFIEKGINQENIESGFIHWILDIYAIHDCHHLETFKFFFENNLLENKQKILFENSQVLHYFTDIGSITENELNDLFVLFINNGANIEIKTNQNENLLHSICLKHPSFIQLTKFLLSLNLDLNAVTNSKQTPLSIICEFSNSKELIPILLSKGANPNYPQNCIDLIKRNHFYFKSQFKDIEYLFWYGAEWKNPPSKGSIHMKINQLFLKTYKSYQEDFLNLFKRQELTDYKIQCKDGFILIHKLILTSRLYLENESEQEILQKFLNFAFQASKTEMEIIVEFLYSGIIEMSNYENDFKFLEKFAQNLGFPKNWIIQKSGKIGLIHDLEKLYQDEKSKDFTIIFQDETTIKVHKLILIARSNLFRGMFLSVVDNSNQVHDYSEIPSKTMKNLIGFLYLDSCSSFENSEIEYFQKAKDYFQLNENCSLDLFFSQPSLANQYFNDEYLNRK
ncbi:ankyrin repeat-containing protein [Anaeramoeba ignava]|uniref:Ankyrin repeat-containing protein n=1 Tax=Anaeramoeba ignava TaxID=1746090 RepID=A0A9Q0L8L0_ANAIG|nr:ankyrin repeat-containing protein [Anaeramoeba ignava]